MTLQICHTEVTVIQFLVEQEDTTTTFILFFPLFLSYFSSLIRVSISCFPPLFFVYFFLPLFPPRLTLSTEKSENSQGAIRERDRRSP